MTATTTDLFTGSKWQTLSTPAGGNSGVRLCLCKRQRDLVFLAAVKSGRRPFALCTIWLKGVMFRAAVEKPR